MPTLPESFISPSAAHEALLRIATDAQDADRRLVDFVEMLWRHCAEEPRRHCLGSLCLPSSTLRDFKKGADSKLDGMRSAYQFFRDWLRHYKHNRKPILTLLQQGHTGREAGKGLASEYRVNLPMCEGDPWPAVRAALPPPVPSGKLRLAEVEAIRLAALRAASRSVRCDRETRQLRLLQTVRMAAYHARAPSSRRKRLLCPMWPNERGVDLAVFDHGAEGVPSQALLAGTGKKASQLSPFERAALRDSCIERVFLSLWTPSNPLRLKARSLEVNVIQIGGLIEAVPSKGLAVRHPRRR